MKYIEEAIASEESDAVTDAGYYYELAVYSLKSRNTSKAYSAAQKALELDPSLAGKAYMVMGTVWGSTVCSGNDADRRQGLIFRYQTTIRRTQWNLSIPIIFLSQTLPWTVTAG